MKISFNGAVALFCGMVSAAVVSSAVVAQSSDASYLAALDTLLTDEQPAPNPEDTVLVPLTQAAPENQPAFEECQSTVAAQFAEDGQSVVVGSDGYLAAVADCMLGSAEVPFDS